MICSFHPEHNNKRRIHMKIATVIARSLLGLIFVVFGSNMFLHFIPMPPPPEGPARDFMTALFVSHYLYVVGALQVVGGFLLFTGRWTPLGLTLVGPVIVNIICFHALMAPAGLPMAIFVSALALFLLWRHRGNFAGLVNAPAGPAETRNQQLAMAASAARS
jgi:putative oxidoreductase